MSSSMQYEFCLLFPCKCARKTLCRVKCDIMFICRYQLHCPLYADGTLKWLGYSVSGVLASYDSTGVLRVAPSTNRNHWVPVLNTSKVYCKIQLYFACYMLVDVKCYACMYMLYIMLGYLYVLLLWHLFLVSDCNLEPNITLNTDQSINTYN